MKFDLIFNSLFENINQITQVPSDPTSPTIEALLLLQSRTSTTSEKGVVTTRILVPSGKVGCILGERGSIITEMRRRTRADIRLFSKEDKPKYTSANEELVQVSIIFSP